MYRYRERSICEEGGDSRYSVWFRKGLLDCSSDERGEFRER